MAKDAYPYIGFRPDPAQEARLRKLALASGEGISDLVRMCVTLALPQVEAMTHKPTPKTRS